MHCRAGARAADHGDPLVRSHFLGLRDSGVKVADEFKRQLRVLTFGGRLRRVMGDDEDRHLEFVSVKSPFAIS
jgi:hypothetical protein